ncbi:MAG: F0F1 ATP synthase subunit beta, partial [Psychroflexus sp.]|nr:F0F1 ATP synthase subunit beta [Psychroflexus sp.]
MAKTTGKIAQIIGPVIDVSFNNNEDLPQIYDSLEIKKKDDSILVLEVQSHIGENMVRTIAMDSADG